MSGRGRGRGGSQSTVKFLSDALGVQKGEVGARKSVDYPVPGLTFPPVCWLLLCKSQQNFYVRCFYFLAFSPACSYTG